MAHLDSNRAEAKPKAAAWTGIARFLLLPAFMAIMAACLLAGGVWLWGGLACYLVIGAGADIMAGEDRSPLPAGMGPIAEAALYATLPLIALCTVLFLHYFTAEDPIGLVAALLAAGVDFDAARREAPWWALAGGVVSMASFFAATAGVVGHELMHRTASRTNQALCPFTLAFCLNPSIAVEHVYGHHRTVGTADDPTTARRGTGFWRYLPRSLGGGIAVAWTIEAERLRRRGQPVLHWRNRVISGYLVMLAVMAAVLALSGWAGLAGWTAAAALALINVELFTYISHYGLARGEGETIAPRHSWCSYAVLSNGLLLNLPRHASHHLNAGKPYWRLEEMAGSPEFPYGANIMALIALVPPLWHEVMAPELAKWDREMASEAERTLAKGEAA